MTVRSQEEAVAALQSLRPPLVVKPLDGNQGKGISLGLTTADEVAAAYDLAAEISRSVIVEEYFQGRDYRALIVDGKMVAASEREPAHVVGDGVHTVAQLIEEENQNPLRGDGHEKGQRQEREGDGRPGAHRPFFQVTPPPRREGRTAGAGGRSGEAKTHARNCG